MFTRVRNLGTKWPSTDLINLYCDIAMHVMYNYTKKKFKKKRA